jgi:hypothetical protein
MKGFILFCFSRAIPGQPAQREEHPLEPRLLGQEREQQAQGGRGSTLIKKKTKFSSYIRKFRWDRVQSHI